MRHETKGIELTAKERHALQGLLVGSVHETSPRLSDAPRDHLLQSLLMGSIRETWNTGWRLGRNQTAAKPSHRLCL